MNTSRIPTLDGWRAIAILLVIVCHIGAGFYSSSEAYWSTSPTRYGTTGVSVFFALSGFLITALLLREAAARGGISFRDFYLRRCFRILPPLLAYLTVLGMLGLFHSQREIAACLLFFRNYLPDVNASVFTAHIWSLSVEEHFYLLWPLSLCLFLSSRKLLRGTAVASLTFGLWRSSELHFHLLHKVVPALDTPMRTDLRLDGLLWGCCAGILFENLRRRGALCFQVPEIALWAAIGLDVLYLTRGVPTGAIWSPALLAVFIILTVLHPAWKTSRVLDFPVLQWIGRISYSLYIWQQLFLVPSWEAHPLGRLQLFPLNLLASLVCAIFSYFVIEQPAIRFGRSLIRRKATSRNEEQSGIKVIQAA